MIVPTVEQGRRPPEVHLLGGDPGPEVRPAAPLPADAEDRAGVRVPRDQEDPGRHVARARATTPNDDRHTGSRGSGPSLESRGIRLGDVLFRGIAVVAAAAATLLLGLIAYKVIEQAWPAIEHFGLSFIWTKAWNPVDDQYGALTFIYGTVVTSVIALLLATPISIAIALFLTEIAPRRIASIATMVELLAAIPSVVLGLWGILVFGPWVAENLEPWLEKWLGFIPLFEGTFYQAGMLPAALVLTIMIVPITSAICRECSSRARRGSHGRRPRARLDALGGDPRRHVRLRRAGHRGGGPPRARRAFGEAIAVAQVIGGSDHINVSLFARPTRSARGSRRSTRGDAAPAGIALYLGAILMVISLVTNVCAQFIVRRFEKQRRAVRTSTRVPGDAFDITTRSNGLRRRRIVEKAFGALAILAALAAVGILALVLGTVVAKGLDALNWDLFTKPRPLFGQEGGIADALIGSTSSSGCMAMAIPVAVLVAIYMSEYASPRIATFLRLVLEISRTGFRPSSSASSCSACCGRPRAERRLRRFRPRDPHADGAGDPGSARHRPAEPARGEPCARCHEVAHDVEHHPPERDRGDPHGVVIAVARVAGETAPLLFTSSIAANAVSFDVSHALPTLPVAIFAFSESPDPSEQAMGWAAAFVLIVFVLVMNVLAKIFAGRKRRQLEGLSPRLRGCCCGLGLVR